MTVITEEEFAEYRQECMEIATLVHGYEFYQAKGLTFHVGGDDLGDYMAACIRLNSGKRVMLFARPQHPNLRDGIGVITLASDPHPIDSMDELLRCLGEDRGLVQWLNPWLTEKPRWVLLEEDRLGRSFVIENCWEEGLCRNDAEYLRKKHPEGRYRVEMREPFPHRGT